MKSSYPPEDVEILLKDISGMVEPLPAKIRETCIQKGTHYCEMLPLEYQPSARYMEAYETALRHYARATARAVGALAEKLYQKKGPELTLVSLARAGIPIGILLRRYLKTKYQVSVKHYAISIIRGRGIDENALNYIQERHKPESLQFVDGWIGKGAILSQLQEALQKFPKLDPELAVISDPANLTALCGTHEDILIPSSCLNATVTGLISRTFLRSDIIGPQDFHGAAFYEELEKDDLSLQFLDAIEREFTFTDSHSVPEECPGKQGNDIVKDIAREYHISNRNFIKPGIGEATRVLLRRIPWKIIVNDSYANADELKHIYQLAAEKQVSCEISRVDLGNYKVCGMIRQLSDV